MDKTWQSIDERKSIKVKKDHLSLTDEDYSQLNTEYKAKDKEVKRLRKEDKIKIRLIESKLQEAETAEAKSDSKTLYMIVKELSGKQRGHVAPVRKLDGSVASIC